MSLVIGLVGEKAGGKGQFATLLAEIAKGTIVQSLRFSDIVRETLDTWHLPHTRANQQKLVVAMNETYGIDTLARATLKRVAETKADIVVVDGVRWDSDVAMIRRFPENALVYVTAHHEIRHARAVSRGEKVGETELSLGQFLEEERAPNEVGIPRIGAFADFTIVNEGTLDDYRAEALRFYRTRFH